MTRKNIIITIIIVIAVAIGIYFFIFKKSEKTFEWRTTKVKRGDISVMVTATGSANPDTTVSVGTQVTGIVMKLYADWNTKVKQGQIIALIDTTFLSATRIDAAASLAKAEVMLAQGKRDYDRNKKLVDEKVVAQADFEQYLTTYESAKTAVASAKAILNRALINLQYAVIRAPVSGVVISRNVELGQTVVASFNTPTLFTIANKLEKMQVQANVGEADIGQIKEGQTATFSVDAYPDTIFEGKIFQIRLQPTTLQNVVNYTVVINVPNPDLKLMPGMTTNISVKVKEHKDVLKVPVNVLHFIPSEEYIKSSKTLPDSVKTIWEKIMQKNSANVTSASELNKTIYVWVKNGNDIFPKKVKVGISDGNLTEVYGDINENDDVVIGTGSIPGGPPPAATNPFMPKMPEKK